MAATRQQFERYYQTLRGNGIGEEAAAAAAIKKFPGAFERAESIREKEEQAEVTKVFQRRGFTVRSTSQARPSKIAIGFPDLFVTHKTRPIAFFWESKRQVKGVLSEAQKEFANDCHRCGVKCLAGDRYHAAAFLRAEGFDA